jgi:hypothetical protein
MVVEVQTVMSVVLSGVGTGLVDIGALQISVVIGVVSEVHFASLPGRSGKKGRDSRSREDEGGDGKTMMEVRRAG